MRNAGLDEAQAGIKTDERNINNLRYADDTTLKAESKEELKSLLMNVKEKSKKAGLKFNIHKTKIKGSGPIIKANRWGKQWKQWQTLFFVAPKSLQMVNAAMTLKDACSLKQSYDKPKQNIQKQKHYFTDKILSSQSYGFSSGHVWM